MLLCDSNVRKEFQKIQNAYLHLKEDAEVNVQQGENPFVKIVMECMTLTSEQQRKFLMSESLNMGVRSMADANEVLTLIKSAKNK